MTIPPIDNTPAFIALIVILVPSIYVLVRVFARFANLRLSTTEKALNAAQAVSGERLRVEALPALLTPDKILYIGAGDNDLMQAVTIFQQSGISNRLITMSSPRMGFEYIRDNPDTVLFVVVFVEDIGRGKAFLDMVKQDDLTVNIPVFFLDGFEDKGKLLLFDEGVNGLLQKPLNINTLLMILNRLGYNSVISKN